MTLLPKSSSSPAIQGSSQFNQASITRGPTVLPTTSSVSPRENRVPSDEPIYTKPFDQWRPLGGGAERDIFRYFKIHRSEQDAFLTLWASKRPNNGFLAHDEDGTLVFRISSAHLSELVALGISGTNCAVPDPNVQWLQVCDRRGLSWLTQFRGSDLESFTSELYDTTGRPIEAHGQIGPDEPSDLSVHDYVTRRS